MAKEVLFKAIDNSAQSFSMMTNYRVSTSDMSIEKFNLESMYHPEDDELLVLKTELVGNVTGINYFVFTREEVKAMYMDYIEKGMSLNEARPMMLEFFKEIENVIAASSISILAQSFELEMYGDVPKVQVVPSKQIKGIIDLESKKIDPKLVLSCTINIPQLQSSPKLYWIFGATFEEQLELAHII